MGHWEEALRSANEVLATDKAYVRALLVKAEALYNTCSFEHALVLFHRGQVKIQIQISDRDDQFLKIH